MSLSGRTRLRAATLNRRRRRRARTARIRSGLSTPSEELQRLGKVPARHWQQLADDWAEIDRLGLVMDSDPRRLSQQGQVQVADPGKVEEAKPAPVMPVMPGPPADEDDDDGEE